MAVTNKFNFLLLNGSDAAGHNTINNLINSIESSLEGVSTGLATGADTPGALTTGQVLRWNGSTYAAALVNAASLDTSAVTESKIADGAVTSAKILDGTIVNADINASAGIAKTKISGTAITAADTGTVTSTMIADGTITTTDLAFDPATQAELDAHAADTTSVHGITDTSDLALKSGSTYTGTHNFSGATLTGTASSASNLTGGAGGSVPYQSGAGSTAMLANGTAGQVLTSNGTTLAPSWQNASIGNSNIADNAITQAKMADNSVGTAEIIDDSVTSDKLRDDASVDANRAVTTNHVRNAAITSVKLADNVITADKIDVTVGGQLGLNQTGNTRRVTASYAPETTTTSTTYVLTGLTNVTIATPGEGVVRGILTAELKNSGVSNSTFLRVEPLNNTTPVFLHGVSSSYNVSLSEYQITDSSNYTLVGGTTYKKASMLFEYVPVFYGSGTNSVFNVSFLSTDSTTTAFVKNIKLSLIWTPF